MKIRPQHLKMAPLVATSLAATAIFVLAILSPQSSAVDVAPAKEPAHKIDDAQPLQEAKSHGSFTLEDLKKFVPQTKDGHFKMEVAELFYTNGDIEVQRVLSGQTVETTGQIAFETTKESTQSLIKVCDLGPGSLFSPRQYAVLLEFEAKPPSMKEREWVRLVGKPVYKTENGQPSLCLRVTAVEILSGPPEKTKPDGTTPAPSPAR